MVPRATSASSAPAHHVHGTCDQTQPHQSVFELQTAAQTKGLTSQVETHIVPLVIHGSTLSGAGEKQARASFLTARLGPPAN